MICRECKSSEGPFKSNPSHKNSGICKKCHSKYNRNRQKSKAAKLSPEKWFNCNDCEEMFNVKKMDGTFHTKCMYCDSEEIETVAEQLGIKK